MLGVGESEAEGVAAARPRRRCAIYSNKGKRAEKREKRRPPPAYNC